ncbi:MAG: ribosome biogenesis GTP-binding protein YihA/YsxC [Alphaproteobacteria bacterium]
MSKTEERINPLFSKNCRFITGAVDTDGLPMEVFPEVAFAGRSNVGKSSLINAVLSRKNLVKTSKTPGRTQQLNFFNLDNKFMMVDLPGYGYAKVSRKQASLWDRFIVEYLRNRAKLQRVFLLLDCRHGIKDNDAEIMDLFDMFAIPYQVVLTKTDKIRKTELAKTEEKVLAEVSKHPAAFPTILSVSSFKRRGLAEFAETILQATHLAE